MTNEIYEKFKAGKKFKTVGGKDVLDIQYSPVSNHLYVVVAGPGQAKVPISYVLSSTGDDLRADEYYASIVQVKEKRTIWINVYKSGETYAHDSEGGAAAGRDNGEGEVCSRFSHCLETEIEADN